MDILTNVIAQLVNKKGTDEYGVFLINLPKFDYKLFVEQLNTQRKNAIFFLDFPEEEVKTFNKLLPTDASLSYYYTTEDAEKLRNDGREDVFRILIARRSESPKLSSLRWYPTIDLDAVYKGCCRYAKSILQDRSNSVIEALINALNSRQIRNILSFDRVIRYLGEIIKATSETETTQVIKDCYYMLGLCADKSFVNNNPSKDELIKRIKHNRDVVERLENLESKERQGITNYYSGKPTNKSIPRLILSYYKTKDIELLSQMDIADVENCLKTAKKPSSTKPTNKPKPTKLTPTSLGAQIVFEGDVEDTKEIINNINTVISDRPDSGKPETLTIDTTYGPVSIKTSPTTSTISSRMTEEDNFGGVIKADVNSPSDAIKDLDKYGFKPFTLNEYLQKAISDLEKFPQLLQPDEKITILENLKDFLQKRSYIVPYKERLQDVPMLQVLSEYQAFSEYLDSYDKLLKSLNEDFPKIWAVAASNAKNLVSIIMSLDNIYIVGKEEKVHAIPTPLNPMYLWKYIKLSEEILLSRGVDSLNENHLSDDDKTFIIRKSEDIPDPLSVMLLPLHLSGGETSFLPLVGRVGCLPVYSLEKQINQSESGENEIKSSLIRYLCLYPHAGMMLRTCFIDPPSVEFVVTLLKNLNNDKEFIIEGIEVSIYRTKETSHDWVEIDNDSLNEGMLGRVKGRDDLNFKFNIHNEKVTYEDITKKLKCQYHIVILFDPNEVKMGLTENDKLVHINPLCVPKIYKFNPMNDEIEIRPSNEGGIFSDYSNIIEKLRDNQVSMFRHTSVFFKTPLKKETYDALLENTDWLIILDQNLKNWDLSLRSRSEKLFYKEYVYRSIGIYSQNSRKFEIGYKSLVSKLGNFIPNEQGIHDVIEAVRSVNDDGLLSIVSHTSNRIFDENHGKGSLGLAIAAIKYHQENQGTVLVGLDTQLAKEWLSNRDEEQLPDLVGINVSSEDNSAIIDVIEVKTYSGDPKSFIIRDNNIEGHAVDQVSVLDTLIKEIFGRTEKVTTISRREILRGQVFESLYQSLMDSRDKLELSTSLNKLFAGGFRLTVNKKIYFIDFNNEGSSNESYSGVDSHLGSTYELCTIGSNEIQSILAKALFDSTTDAKEIVPVEETIETPTNNSVQNDRQEDTQECQIKTEELPETVKDDIIVHDLNKDEQIKPIREELTTESDKEGLREKSLKLNQVLRSYQINAHPVSESDIEEAARFTRFRVRLKAGETVKNLIKHKEDFAIQLQSSGEILIQHIRGTDNVAIDVPFANAKTVTLLDNISILGQDETKLNFLTGQTPDGVFKITDLAQAPHLLVSGTTGSGKTIFLYSLIVSLLHQFSSDQIKFLIIDPKQTDFIYFDDIPSYLYGQKVIIDSDEAIQMIRKINDEDKVERTNLLRESRCRDIGEYNLKNPGNKMPRIVIIIDEYADLVQTAEMHGKNERRDFEQMLVMLAQRVRNLGIHLVIATQRPSANIVTGALKTNIPLRISLKLPSHVDSQTILDQPGAEDLLGHGDLLLSDGGNLTRMQGLYINTVDLENYIQSKK